MMFLITTIAPPIAMCHQLEKKIPPPAIPPHGVKKGPRTVNIITPRVTFSKDASDAEISGAHVFAEPLAPLAGEPVAGENQALAKALLAYKNQNDRDDVTVLTRFLSDYPKSRWKPALELNIAERRYESGYFSDALNYWQSIWTETKDETKPATKAIADQALNQLLLLDTRLGRTQEFKDLLSQIDKRPVYGTLEHSVKQAKQALLAQTKHPEKAYKCGPYAINSILNIGRATPAPNAVLDKCQSTSKGTSFAQVKGLADKVGLHYQLARRSTGAKVVVPAVIHFKLGHFVAIVAKHGDKYRLTDPTFDEEGNMWVTSAALDAETDGSALIPDGALPSGWTKLSEEEASSIWGRGGTPAADGGLTPSQPTYGGGGGGGNRGGSGPKPCTCQPAAPPDHCPCGSGGGGGGPLGGMASASGFALQATLKIEDSPLNYSPPVGPFIDFHLNYNYLEGMQPASFTFTNLGQDWNFNWSSYLTLDSSQNATVRVRGGGYELYSYLIPDNATNPYSPNLTSQAVLTIVSPGVYQRQLPDGSIEVFNQPDGTGRIFMTQVIDPRGNSATVQYQQLGTTYWRISTITDAIGQVSTVSYASNSGSSPLCVLITAVTDPFSRSAVFGYDSTNSFLLSITDPINIKSQFAYVTSSSLINQLTTPYGTTSFQQLSFPDDTGDTETVLKMVYPDNSSEVIRSSTGYGFYPSNSWYWDREAMMQNPFDYYSQVPSAPTQSSIWLTSVSYVVQPVRYSLQYLLESTAVSYTYAGQGITPDGDHVTPGPLDLPATISQGQQSPDGTQGTQTFAYQYNACGKVTQSVAPNPTGGTSPGYTMNYRYAPNNIDLLEVRGPNNDLLGKWIYNNTQHLPNKSTDGSGQSTLYTYNAAGQPLTVTDPLGHVTTNIYNADGFLVQTNGPLPGNSDVTTMTYDGYNRLYSSTNSEGYTTYLSYDNADRITQINYLDGTTEQTIYSNLDAVMSKDRIGRWTQYAFDEMDNMASSTDPLGRTTHYKWCSCGSLTSIVDPNGNTTSFQYDNRNRLIGKTYPDNTQIAYTYDSIGRLMTRTTPAQNTSFSPTPQTTNYNYNLDNTMSCVTYSYSVNQTPSVLYSWDPTYPRLTEVRTADSCPPSPGTIYSDLVYTYNGYVNNPFAAFNVFVGGKPQAGDYVNVTVLNSSLSGGKHNVQYTVQSGDAGNLNQLATDLASAINADSTLSAAGYKATASSSLVAVSAPTTLGLVTASLSANGATTETLAGTARANDTVNLTVQDAGLTGGSKTKSYTVSSGNNLSSIASGLATAINADTSLQAIGVTASASSAVLTITSTSVNATTYTGGVVSGTSGVFATETISQTGGPSENATAGGGGMLQSSVNNTISTTTATVSYSYDAIGRTVSRWINGNANPVSWNYDPMSRLTTESNNLGTFAFHYLDDIPGSSKGTAMLSSINYPNGQTTNFNYLPVTQDQRLQGITNFDPLGRVRSQFNYGYDSAGQISRWAQQNAGMTPTTYNFGYDQAGQLSAAYAGFGAPNAAYAAQNYYNYDPAANRTAAQKSTIQTATIAGTITANDTLNITIQDSGLPGGQETVPYTVQSGDTTSTVAAKLAAKLCADPNLQAVGVNAIAVSNVIKIKSVSANAESYSQSTSGGATETITFGISANAVQNIAIGLVGAGYTSRANDSVALTVYDAGLSGGREVVPAYTVPANNTSLSTIASGLASKINSDTNLSAIHISATSAGNIVSITSTSGNATSYVGSVTPVTAAATETISLSANNSGSLTATVAGTITTGDLLSLSVRSLGLTGGQEAVSYLVSSGDTTTTIATALKNAINGDANLSAIGVTATSSGAVVTITTATPTYTKSTPGTETITFGTNSGGNVAATIGGTVTGGDILTISSHYAALPGGQEPVNYTVQSSDTLSTIAANFAARFNADANLQKATINATASGAVINIKYSAVNYPAYITSASGGATETMALTMNCNGSQNFVVAGTVTTGNTVSMTTYDIGLAGGQETDTYTVQSGDTLSTITTGLKTAINSDTSLQALGISATNSSTVLTVTSNSLNATSFIPFTGSGATETINPGNPNGTTANILNGTQTAVLSGSITTGNSVSITTYDAGLSGGQKTKTYPITGSDTGLASVAANLVSLINGDSSLSGIGVSATSVATGTGATSPAVINIASTSVNPTNYSASTSGGASENFVLASNVGVKQAVYNHLNELVGATGGGATRFQANTNKPVKSANVSTATLNLAWNNQYPTTFNPGGNNVEWNISSYVNPAVAQLVSFSLGQVVSISTTNAALPGGSVIFSHTPISGDTTTSIISSFVSSINASSSLKSIGVSATSSSNTITIVVNNPTYTATTTPGGATENVTFGPNLNGTTTATVGGSVTAGDTISLTAHFLGLSGGQETIPAYTVLSTDTLESIAAILSSRINADANLNAISLNSPVNAANLNWSKNFTANPSLTTGGNPVATSATDGGNNTTTNSYQISAAGTNYTQSTSTGATETITLGTSNNGNVTATVGGSVTAGDTVTITASGPVFSQTAQSATYTVQSGDTLNSIASSLTSALNTTLNSFGVTATSSSAIITITGSAGLQPFTYDQNGNMLSDGVNTYIWDAENRLITINYPGSGNFTSFSYDGIGNRVKIVETVGGTIISTKQFIFAQGGICEARDAGGTNVLNQYFKHGETINSSSYFFECDHLGSVRELTDINGNIQAQYAYDVYGQPMTIKQSVGSDFQFAGYYIHGRSRLALTETRSYNSNSGRWLSRDPSESEDNLFTYISNCPIIATDPSGLLSEGELRKVTGIVEFGLAEGLMSNMCDCNTCMYGHSTEVPTCKSEATKISNSLLKVWTKFDTSDKANEGVFAGGQKCYNWVTDFQNDLNSKNLQIWKLQLAQSSIPNQTDAHYALAIFIKYAQDPSVCQIYVDDGFGNGDMVNKKAPWPTGYKQDYRP